VYKCVHFTEDACRRRRESRTLTARARLAIRYADFAAARVALAASSATSTAAARWSTTQQAAARSFSTTPGEEEDGSADQASGSGTATTSTSSNSNSTGRHLYEAEYDPECRNAGAWGETTEVLHVTDAAQPFQAPSSGSDGRRDDGHPALQKNVPSALLTDTPPHQPTNPPTVVITGKVGNDLSLRTVSTGTVTTASIAVNVGTKTNWCGPRGGGGWGLARLGFSLARGSMLQLLLLHNSHAPQPTPTPTPTQSHTLKPNSLPLSPLNPIPHPQAQPLQPHTLNPQTPQPHTINPQTLQPHTLNPTPSTPTPSTPTPSHPQQVPR